MSKELMAQIDSAFQHEIEPVNTTGFYKMGLLLVTLVMLLLPVIYLFLVGVLGWGLFYHATHNYTVFENMPARAAILVYVTPLVAGVILFYYMVRPLIPRLGNRPHPLYTITEENEPQVYRLIGHVCDSVGAPFPRRIDLIMEANASASFRRGFLSFLSGDDLVLSIGLPLLSSLSVQQLAGVLAHEMGHFSQGAGMRCSYIINRVNYWFVEAIYGGRSMNEKLADAAESTGGSFALLLMLTQLFIFLSRGVLYLLMMVGYFFSNFLSRQMEYDADLNQIRVSGSTSFESTMYSIVLLDAAFSNASMMSMLTRRFQILSNDLPNLVKSRGKSILRENKDELINSILEPNTRLFDTHPSPRDRIAHAKRQQEKGICKIKAPASSLFQNFNNLSVNLTSGFYLDVLGPETGQYKLLAVDEYIQHFNDNLDRYHPQTRRVAI